MATEVGERTVCIHITQGQCIAVVAGIADEDARAIVVRGIDVIVTGRFIFAPWNFSVIADAVSIDIGGAVSIAHAQCIELADAIVYVIANAIDVGVSRTVTIANANGIQVAHAIVDVVTNAIDVGICQAVASTYAKSVELVAVAVAIASRNAGAIADATSVQITHTGIHIVTDAI